MNSNILKNLVDITRRAAAAFNLRVVRWVAVCHKGTKESWRVCIVAISTDFLGHNSSKVVVVEECNSYECSKGRMC